MSSQKSYLALLNGDVILFSHTDNIISFASIVVNQFFLFDIPFIQNQLHFFRQIFASIQFAKTCKKSYRFVLKSRFFSVDSIRVNRMIDNNLALMNIQKTHLQYKSGRIGQIALLLISIPSKPRSHAKYILNH